MRIEESERKLERSIQQAFIQIQSVNAENKEGSDDLVRGLNSLRETGKVVDGQLTVQ